MTTYIDLAIIMLLNFSPIILGLFLKKRMGIDG